MGEEITTIDISNAEVLSASSFTNVKNSINIKIDNSGDLTDANDNAVTMLNFGDRGDHCVTVINAELPSNFSEGYLAYFLVDLKNKTYIQKCLMEGNIAKALITKEISLDSQSTECLFALIEANATTGNLREQQEIFVSDVFMGTVRSNFLDSNWMDADISVSEDLTVLDKFETPNPDKYTSMVWVNGETKLNAANMNNIIKGIDELKEQAVEVNPSEAATELLSKIKINDKILASGKTYQYDDIVENGTLKDGIFNEILQLAVLGCSNITIIQSDLLFTFVGLGAAMKNGSTVIGLVFHSNMVVYPTDTEKHSMCVELILFEDNSVSDGGTFNLPEPPSFSDDVQDKKYILELHKSDSLSEFTPQWVEKTNNTLIKNGTYYSTNGSIIFNTLSLTEDELTRLNNKEINTILGSFILTESGNQTDYCIHFNGSNFISYEYTTDDLETYVDYITYGIMMIEGNQAILARVTTRTAFVPKIPAENNKILITNNGKLKYVDIPGSIEVNPSEEATDTLNKLKIDGTVYNFNKRLEKTGTLISDENGMFVNAIFLTDEEFEKVKNGEIDTIYGTYYKDSLTSSPYTCSFSKIIDQGEGELSYVFTNSSSMVENGILSIILFQCTISKSNSMLITIEKKMPVIPLLPTDASGKTLSLISTNGSIGWKDASVGTQKFENVEVSGTITTGGKSLNAVEANPSDAATTSLNKIKIGNVVYNIVGSSSSGGSSGSDKPNKSNSTLKKDGTFKSQNGPIIINSINFTDEELERINNREIDSIYGSFDAHGSKTEYRVFFSDFFGDLSFNSYSVDIDSAALDDHRRVTYTNFIITILEGSWVIVRTENDAAYVPSAPSTNNKTLVTDNGYLKYVDMPDPVIANPSTTPTETIKTIKIGKTTYYIAGSSGSGGSGGSSGIPDLPEDAATKQYVLSNSTIAGTNVLTWIENTYNGHMTENQLMSYVDESSPIGLNVSQMRSDLINGKFLTMIAGDGGLSFISDLYDQTKSHGISMLRVEDGYMEQSCIYKNSTEEELANSMNKKYLFVPDLPSDASSTNYILSSENGVLTWTKIEDKISSAINNAITSTLEANY